MKNNLYLFIILIVLISCQSKQDNKSESSSSLTVVPIQQARNLSIGSEVRIQGTISVASGNFFSSTPFGYALQDNTAGIYIIDSIPPMQDEFKLGEIVEVTGILGESNNMLFIEEVTALKKGKTKLISAVNVKTGEVDESTEGMILHTSGIIDSLFNDLPYGYKVYINDGSGLLNIFINTSTGLLSDTIEWQISDSFSVTGFSAQYDTEYEIEPRTRDDMQVFTDN
ncbi:MAG: hypothetical protein JKY48_08090 [Flavobacteriales bacterium]|nr:hypothetical protein [Flavobacteriales bacterium]